MIRTVAYCRVSTDQADQANSFASQKRYFEEFIQQQEGWQLGEIYADEGVSGTSVRNRTDFHRMIQDAEAGKFDQIITKEVSRFARNTLDSIFYTRRLRDWGIGVFFLTDHIHTLDPDAELRLTILSSLAQEESRRTSARVKWGQKRRMEQGVVFGRSLLGYDVHNGNLFIQEDGAALVRLIYHKFLEERKGTHVIARELREEGIPTPRGNTTWSNTTILRILRNEKYCGDLIQKKTFTPNYLTHQKKYNRGEESLVVLRHHHPPIIPRTQWEQVQKELQRRVSAKGIKAPHGNRYALSGKIRCTACGCSFVCRSRKNRNGSSSRAWRCLEAVRNGPRHFDPAGNSVGCQSPAQIPEKEFFSALQQIVATMHVEQTDLLPSISHIFRRMLQQQEVQGNNRQKQLEQKQHLLLEKNKRLLDFYAAGEISKEEFRIMHTFYEKEQQELSDALQKNAAKETPLAAKERVSDLMSTSEQVLCGKQGDASFYASLLDHIDVRPGGMWDIFLHGFPQPWTYSFQK